MTVFRDWPSTLQQASFRGAHFFVDSDQVDTGRRLVVHEFPLKDVPYIEDLGREANKISVRAYVVSDRADSEERALRSACERGGAGRLSLPLETFQVHCESCQRDFSKDKLGYIAFILKFVRDGLGSAPLPAGFLASHVLDLATGAGVAASAAVLSLVRVAGMPSLVVDAAVAHVTGLAATLDVMARAAPLEISRAPVVLAEIAALYDDAEALVMIGEMPDRLTRTASVAALASDGSRDLGKRVAGLLDVFRMAVTPDAAMAHLEVLLDYKTGGSGVSVSYATPSRKRIGDNDAALDAMVRQVALTTWAAAAASMIFTDRKHAVQVRADASERFDAELSRVVSGTPHDVYVALSDLQAGLVEYLSRRIADMAPVVMVEAARIMPSLWWANRIYGGHTRAAELVKRNRVIHAAFMPDRLEAITAS